MNSLQLCSDIFVRFKHGMSVYYKHINTLLTEIYKTISAENTYSSKTFLNLITSKLLSLLNIN